MPETALSQGLQTSWLWAPAALAQNVLEGLAEIKWEEVRKVRRGNGDIFFCPKGYAFLYLQKIFPEMGNNLNVW